MLNTALAREHWIDVAEINIEAVVAGFEESTILGVPCFHVLTRLPSSGFTLAHVQIDRSAAGGSGGPTMSPGMCVISLQFARERSKYRE